MDLTNKEVTHKVFGRGQIVQLNDSVVEIDFGTESKKFVFPDAFGKFLKLHDEEAIHSLNKILEKKEIEEEQEKLRLEKEKEQLRKKQQLRAEFEKLMKNHKLHPQSQVVFWCDKEEQNNVFKEWQVFTGVIKSGKNKGTPRKLSRLLPNSACLLTVKESHMPETERKIIGVFMVKEDFVGKLREDGYIPAHTKFKIQLSEKEANKLLFWNYYINEKHPHKMTWNSGKFRYFDNLWMAQIIRDIVSLKEDPQEKGLAQQFFDHFCHLNKIDKDKIPQPNGGLKYNSH